MSDKQFHHGKDHHIWEYSLHLGPFTDSNGESWDLGIYRREGLPARDLAIHVSFANVYGTEAWEYTSGEVAHFVSLRDTGELPKSGAGEARWEALKRWEDVAPEDAASLRKCLKENRY
mgnify:CR=1 FL=1|tara:strand:- start:938 stop:1291 length:354 start_codon:yes stop_codon:yes gene_type:complete